MTLLGIWPNSSILVLMITKGNLTVKDFIRYDLLVQNAMRDVIRRVVADVADANELPGDHHFYITFDTNHEGVEISDRLKEQYPEQMTIVLQHQFWSLKIENDILSVGLSFDQIPEVLNVPLEAVRGFYDPSVNFGLQFEQLTDLEAQDAGLERKVDTVVQRNGKGGVVVNSDQDQTPDNINTDSSEMPEQKSDDDDGENVVSLDKFRKKS